MDESRITLTQINKLRIITVLVDLAMQQLNIDSTEVLGPKDNWSEIVTLDPKLFAFRQLAKIHEIIHQEDIS